MAYVFTNLRIFVRKVANLAAACRRLWRARVRVPEWAASAEPAQLTICRLSSGLSLVYSILAAPRIGGDISQHEERVGLKNAGVSSQILLGMCADWSRGA